ncbi:hypothetical protein [Halocynthiibacter sp.]|uniref:hypothetical protein n=1 Tax=Halocynthiibacter sp. TaxID=1979210 RepID=UPI003C36A7B3
METLETRAREGRQNALRGLDVVRLRREIGTKPTPSVFDRAREILQEDTTSRLFRGEIAAVPRRNAVLFDLEEARRMRVRTLRYDEGQARRRSALLADLQETRDAISNDT